MHALLADFSRAVRAERGDASRDVWLALAVLHKRAYSSAHALRATIARRLAAMEPDEGDARQLPLPLDSHGETDAADEAPGWQPAHQPARQRARTASPDSRWPLRHRPRRQRETKLSALVRLLNRIAEPVIVFTEYRDTLAHVAAIARSEAAGRRSARRAVAPGTIGGARSVRGRRARRFFWPPMPPAKDSISTGSCRTVINLELPWNPMRLEQRIGRVDRIGQRRTVHAFHLIAAGTGEHRLLTRTAEQDHPRPD